MEPSLSSTKQAPFFHCTIARLAAAHTFLMAEISRHALTDLSLTKAVSWLLLGCGKICSPHCCAGECADFSCRHGYEILSKRRLQVSSSSSLSSFSLYTLTLSRSVRWWYCHERERFFRVFFGPEPWWLWLGWQQCQCEFSCSLGVLQRRGEKESWEEQLRRRRWRGVTSGVANTCAEDEKQPWVNGEKKFVYHGARLVRKSRSSVAMWEVKWTRIGCSKQREKIQESKALQKTTLQTSCSTSSERKHHPHVLGITWAAMNLEIDLCSQLDFLHAVLNILAGFWQ